MTAEIASRVVSSKQAIVWHLRIFLQPLRSLKYHCTHATHLDTVLASQDGTAAVIEGTYPLPL